METTDINSQHASSVLDRLNMALKDDSFLIHTPKLIIDHERLYRQFKKIFDECDYMFNRHNVKICVAVFKMIGGNDSISNIDFKNILRLTDKHLHVDEKYHIVIFTFCNAKMAYQAASRIDKILRTKLKAFNNEVLTCAIIQRKINNNLFDIFKQCCHLVEVCDSGIMVVEH